MEPILHITGRAQWEAARAAGAYRGDTLDSTGFIHCSLPRQVLHVANRFYRGTAGLVLLVIDRARVASPVRDEDSEGDLFPHIYGALNLDAVVRAVDFRPRADGTFALPPGAAG